MSGFTALFDACVLYPAPLRDLLPSLAQTDLFRARWTEDIHAEWIRNVEKDRPEIALKLGRTRELMNASVFGIHAEHPDQFISNLFDLSPPQVATQVKAIRARSKNPPYSVDELLIFT